MPFWRLIKDENHEISCVQFSLKFLDNIEIFMILDVILRASLTKIIKKSLDVCKKSLRQHRPRFAPLDALRQRCIFIDFPYVFQWFQWKFNPRWDFIDKFEICGLRQAGPASTRANIVKLYDFNFAYFSLCFFNDFRVYESNFGGLMEQNRWKSIRRVQKVPPPRVA